MAKVASSTFLETGNGGTPWKYQLSWAFHARYRIAGRENVEKFWSLFMYSSNITTITFSFWFKLSRSNQRKQFPSRIFLLPKLYSSSSPTDSLNGKNPHLFNVESCPSSRWLTKRTPVFMVLRNTIVISMVGFLGENCFGINIHNFCHLTDYVDMDGSKPANCLFPFTSENGFTSRLGHAKNSAIESIMKQLLANMPLPCCQL